MVLRRIPDSQRSYHLISFDKRGAEEKDEDGTLGSATMLTALTAPPNDVTDVFILSHGWHGDFEGAIRQYDDWIGAADLDRPHDGIRPFVIGLHWPSKAWSDRSITSVPGGLLGGSVSAEGGISVEEAVKEFAETLGDPEKSHADNFDAVLAALTTIIDFAASIDPDVDAADADELPSDVVEAYEVVANKVQATAGDDPLLGGADWDPRAVFASAAHPGEGEDDGLLGGGGLWSKLRDAVLAPLRQLSFWVMKDRARVFGENGGSLLLRRIQEAEPPVRVHLMGHSFGTIVVSAMVRGPGNVPKPPSRPVESLFLVQGAVSLWAFAEYVPNSVGGGRGYFADLARPEFVAGPIIATRSDKDYAVGRYYPLAVRVVGQFLLDGSPKYGAIGAFGIKAEGAEELAELLPGNQPVPKLEGSRIYNVEASHVIKTLHGLEGAHNDIAHPEVARLAWGAARWRIPAG